MDQNSNNPVPEHYEEDIVEIDLREVFVTIWQAKWFIVGLVLLASLAAFAFTRLTTEVQYEVRSDILLMPPRYTEIEVSRMTRETYLNLAQNDDILNRVIEELELTDEEGELWNPENLEGKIDLTLLVEENGEPATNVSHLLRFTVTDSDPVKASRIANTWAELFRDDILEIRTAEVEEIFQITERRYDQARDRLEEGQEELQELKEEARLETLEAEKENYREELTKFENTLLSLRTERKEKETEIIHTTDTLEGLAAEDARWLGEDVKLDSEEMREELSQVISNYQRLREELFAFQEEYDLTARRNELEYLSEQLADRREEKASLEREYSRAQYDLAEIETLLAEEPTRWDLEKSLTEDAFWDNIFSPEELELLAEMVLREERVNPVYERLALERADLEVAINSLPAQITDLEEEIDRLSEEEEALRLEIAEKEEEKEDLERNKELYAGMYEEWQARYEEFKDEQAELDIELEELEARINMYDDYRNELKEELERREDLVWDFERREENLTRNIASYENTYNRLSDRIEEARVAQTEQTSDVRFVSQAVPPGRTIGRGTLLNMVIAAFLAGMLAVFIVFFRQYMKEESQEN